MKRARNLPRVADQAWHGPIGEAVTRIAPATEADPVAILVQALALFGAMVGNGPHVSIGANRHPAQLWPLIVGRTSTARKGTSLAEARRFAEAWSPYAKGYVRGRMQPGLSTGEGLLTALGADPPRAAKKGDQAEPPPEAVAPDGRLTATETEFANVLAVLRREGNNLGGVLRQMWDDGRGSTMTRGAPLRVDDAHLVVIGHVTPGELRKKLTESDVVGGTVNRFLFCAAERPHLLPYEERREPLGDLAEQLGEYLERAHNGTPREYHRDRAAEQLWASVYHALNADEYDGNLGAALARGPAYTMRLALTYALADGAGAIGVQHLMAGLAVWHYAAQSARLVFGTGRRDDIHRLAEHVATAAGGRSLTDLYRFFGRHKSRGELHAMLTTLEDRGDITREEQATGGRPVTLVHWTGAPLDAVGELLERHAAAP